MPAGRATVRRGFSSASASARPSTTARSAALAPTRTRNGSARACCSTFRMEVGYHLDEHNDVSVYFEHMSNAYTEKFNEGLDRIGVRYGYRF